MNIPNPPVPFGQLTEREIIKSDLLRLDMPAEMFQYQKDISTEELRELRDTLRAFYEKHGIKEDGQ